MTRVELRARLTGLLTTAVASLDAAFGSISPVRLMLSTKTVCGRACRRKGSSVVMVNPTVAEALLGRPGGEAALLFVLAHEVAHHALGHVGKRPKDLRPDELGADAWAVKTVAELGYDIKPAMDLLREFGWPGAADGTRNTPPSFVRETLARRIGTPIQFEKFVRGEGPPPTLITWPDPADQGPFGRRGSFGSGGP